MVKIVNWKVECLRMLHQISILIPIKLKAQFFTRDVAIIQITKSSV